MFTGIVEEVGRVRAVTPNDGGARLEIEATRVLEDARPGDSIAVNGCCLTVVELRGSPPTRWAADAQAETLDRTTIGALDAGASVNLERPVRLADRLGGHIVQGHVDATAELVERVPLPDDSARLRFAIDRGLRRYVVEKGSVTVDGVSLTVAACGPDWFEVALIPHTLAVTTLGALATGERVNLEVDVLAKYVEQLLVPPGREG